MTMQDNKHNLSRADFLKASCVAGAALGGAALLSGCAADNNGQAVAASPDDIKWDIETDVVVVGSGNGGFSAACAAAEAGKKVTLVEISKTIGGGSAWSGGGVHVMGLQNPDQYESYTEGMHDPVLGPKYFKAFPDYSDWVRATVGTELGTIDTFNSDKDFQMGNGEPWTPNIYKYFDGFKAFLESHEGTLLMETRAVKVYREPEGAVFGIVARKADDTLINIKAPAVVLACGGFQNNPELRVRYLGPDADDATILGAPYNTGEGMKMALEVGASLRGSMSTFSATWGSAWPAINPAEDPEKYEELPLPKIEFYQLAVDSTPPGIVLLNLDGKRYTDESAKWYRAVQAGIKQRRATSFMIWDDEQYRTWDVVNSSTGKTRTENFEYMKQYGGIIIEADTLEDLVEQFSKLSPMAIHKANALKTLQEYVQAENNGTTADLEVPRAAPANLKTPPFHGWVCRPAIYCNYGGVAINGDAQVLDYEDKVIPGFYAVPPTAGGVFREIYTGAIGMAGIYGWFAGKHIGNA
jgi:succinate dehydrogenase/fumarate reductase flavoprotein subunit